MSPNMPPPSNSAEQVSAARSSVQRSGGWPASGRDNTTGRSSSSARLAGRPTNNPASNTPAFHERSIRTRRSGNTDDLFAHSWTAVHPGHARPTGLPGGSYSQLRSDVVWDDEERSSGSDDSEDRNAGPQQPMFNERSQLHHRLRGGHASVPPVLQRTVTESAPAFRRSVVLKDHFGTEPQTLPNRSHEPHARMWLPPSSPADETARNVGQSSRPQSKRPEIAPGSSSSRYGDPMTEVTGETRTSPFRDADTIRSQRSSSGSGDGMSRDVWSWAALGDSDWRKTALETQAIHHPVRSSGVQSLLSQGASDLSSHRLPYQTFERQVRAGTRRLSTSPSPSLRVHSSSRDRRDEEKNSNEDANVVYTRLFANAEWDNETEDEPMDMDAASEDNEDERASGTQRGKKREYREGHERVHPEHAPKLLRHSTPRGTTFSGHEAGPSMIANSNSTGPPSATLPRGPIEPPSDIFFFPCGFPGCGKRISTNQRALTKHIKKAHWASVSFCDSKRYIHCGWADCDYAPEHSTPIQLDNYSKHVICVHSGAAFICQICLQKQYKRKDALKRHKRKCGKTQCERCTESFDPDVIALHEAKIGTSEQCEPKKKKKTSHPISKTQRSTQKEEAEVQGSAGGSGPR